MKCLKEIDNIFLLNWVCRNEIEIALSYFDKQLLNVDYSGSDTFVLSKDDDYGYCHKITAARIKRHPDRYAIELIKTGFQTQQGNKYYMTITDEGLLIRRQCDMPNSFFQKTKITEEIKYIKTKDGFVRRTTSLTKDTLNDCSIFTNEEQESFYMVKETQALEICRSEHYQQMKFTEQAESIIGKKDMVIERDESSFKKVYVTMNDTSFVSKVEGDTLPDHQTLLLNRVKEKNLNQIHYIKNRK